MNPWLMIVATVMLTSLATIGGLVLVARVWLLRWLRSSLDDAGRDAARVVRSEVEAAGEEVLPRLREQVKAGVEDGAEVVLPQLRAEVRGGIEDAAASVLGPESLERAGESVVRTGASVIGAGLDLILGRRSDRDDHD